MVIHEDVSLQIGSRLCVPVGGIRQKLLIDLIDLPLQYIIVALRCTKTSSSIFWWRELKREIVRFVSKCLVYQQVKVEHQSTVGLL